MEQDNKVTYVGSAMEVLPPLIIASTSLAIFCTAPSLSTNNLANVTTLSSFLPVGALDPLDARKERIYQMIGNGSLMVLLEMCVMMFGRRPATETHIEFSISERYLVDEATSGVSVVNEDIIINDTYC